MAIFSELKNFRFQTLFSNFVDYLTFKFFCFLQMKSGVSMMGLQLCGWPTGMLSSNIPFTSPLPSLGAGLGLSEGNSNSFLIPNVASNKSESPVPQNEKVSSAQPAAVEVAKPVDFPSPKPIPEGRYIEMVGTLALFHCYRFLYCTQIFL